MGVKDFTKVFESNGEFKYKDFNNKNVAIDASVEIYRAALGMKKLDTLTDAFGNPTGHINVILLNILKLKANNANQYWIFDYNDSENKDKDICHNPLKQLELQRRKEKRMDAKDKITELKKKLDTLTLVDKETELNKDNDLFTDEEDNDNDNDKNNDKNNESLLIEDKLNKQEKIAFSPKAFYFEDVKFMLDMLDIPYLTCPAGFDAEQIAAIATNIPIFKEDQIDKKMDCVMTPDADCLVFGAKQLIKRDIKKKKLFKYDLQDILDKYEITQDDLIKISLILGTDFASKTPRIGPKTVLKKFKDIELNAEQQAAYNNNFSRKLTNEEILDIKKSITVRDNKPFSNKEKYITLLDWLEKVKNFNRSRIEGHFGKLSLYI